ncbi:hypothetical protein [Butyrivibrio proteoclasticus]|nr:hypothetical protein [Butyrivibrio proteoclasticus]
MAINLSMTGAENMKCIHCDTEMITANMDTGMTVGSYFYLWNKEKGIFNSRKTTTVKVYVCPDCGYIELRAEKPENLVINKKS